jgi:primosomal protein N' (replication factor Y) (superfamily II helicase)
MKNYVDVALPLPVRTAFTYEVPENFQSEVSPGKRVLVPFGRRSLTGFVLGPAQKLPPRTRILPLRQVLDEEISIPNKLLELLLWVSSYYLQPIGAVIQTAFPAGTSLRSRERFLLTEKGLAALGSLAPDSLERKILEELKGRGKGGMVPAGFIKKFSSPLRPCLETMREKEWIEKKEEIGKPRVREKTVSWVRFLKNPEDHPLTPLQREVLHFLQQAGEIPLGEVKKKYAGAPSILPRLESHGLAEVFPKEAFRQPSWEEVEDWADGPPFLLTDDQKMAVEEISAALHSGKFRPFLLHGVTGSGKTEVYLRAIQEALSQGRQALLLVPEISLTAQLVAYFRSRIGEPLAVLHSGLSPGERYDEWRRVRKGLVRLVIGVRSAIFAPLESPGILIVDEEHDPSYKQEEKVRYNARDLALVRGKMEAAVVVLGSATPSLESYYNALGGKFRLLPLPSRIDQRPLPEIQVLDMRLEQGKGKERPILSRALEEALRQNGEREEQALLFLNRRGFSTFALCRDCGFTPRCPNCCVSLTYHLPGKTFRCHHCDYSLPVPDRCPECSSPGLMLFGIGTQRLEEEIKKKFPEIHAARMDRDTTAGKDSHQRILGQVRRGEVNLLIGTQMIAKGHDLPRVTLVGVLAADLSLNVPDFRAGERTFQLLTQVAGRAGRGSLPGKVIIQTYNPAHYSIQFAKAQDYPAFYRQETQYRKEMSYPPFVRLINLRLEGNSEARLLKCARQLEGLVQRMLKEEKKNKGQVQALGPSMAPLARLKGKFRCQLLLKGKKWSSLHDFAEELLRKTEASISIPGVKLIIDVDPVHML